MKPFVTLIGTFFKCRGIILILDLRLKKFYNIEHCLYFRVANLKTFS